MYRVFKAMEERMTELLMGSSELTVDAAAGSKEITVANSELFGLKALNDYYGTVMLKDDNTTGEIGLDGQIEGVEFVKVDHISGDKVVLQTPLENSWSTANNALVVRAPNEVIIQDVIMGDVRVETSYPAVCIIPSSKQISWVTLSGTMDAISIDFIVYSRDTDTESGVESVIKLADVIEHILMHNIHINLKDCEYQFERTSKSIVSNVDYATIQKGSEFLQAARLNWKADLYTWRLYVTIQSGVDEFPVGAPKCE